jgi:outer membrane murein-binding lipoprotein Lpp
MDDVWSHPMIVATYVAVLSLVIAGARALFGLFHRVKNLEEQLTALNSQFAELSHDLRAHMLDEARNVQHLEASISRLTGMVDRIGAGGVGLRE